MGIFDFFKKALLPAQHVCDEQVGVQPIQERKQVQCQRGKIDRQRDHVGHRRGLNQR